MNIEQHIKPEYRGDYVLVTYRRDGASRTTRGVIIIPASYLPEINREFERAKYTNAVLTAIKREDPSTMVGSLGSAFHGIKKDFAERFAEELMDSNNEFGLVERATGIKITTKLNDSKRGTLSYSCLRTEGRPARNAKVKNR